MVQDLVDGAGRTGCKFSLKCFSKNDTISYNLTPVIGYEMNKNCTRCNIELNEENRVCYGYRDGKPRIRSICNICRSKESMIWAQRHKEERNEYVRSYLRKSGRVKSYPCLQCNKLCEKKYALSLCSEFCRFMHYVLKTDYCWIWKGGRNHQGYGRFYMNEIYMPAHRASYILFNGSITEGKYICHTCDNPPCVNPGHLWEGTNSENQLDSVKKGRRPKHRKVKNDI